MKEEGASFITTYLQQFRSFILLSKINLKQYSIFLYDSLYTDYFKVLLIFDLFKLIGN